ncbi:Swt1 family HEPN domain-containing protein [Ammonicoccus fulvus]|uniref:Swt1 family HEPN domain-containing protein n=1 Tax=Ammonicoccus fulvus TaxID=3138240 RepID=A0ABZ3FPH4_9ACTN
MALSNRDRIGRMFEILAPALDAYLSRTVDGHLNGLCWFDLFDELDRRNGRSSRPVDAGDVQVQLRFITEGITNQLNRGWRPIRDEIGHAGESYASELREVRNDWAHMKRFTDDDAYRALDTCQRLLKLIGAAPEAEGVGRLRQELRRVTAEKDDRRTLSTTTSAESHGLLPWREVLPPHHDVASGNFQASEFAADLYKVATGQTDTGREYADPIEFFDRTYLTDGLRDLISRAVRRLGGDLNASPVINLQTNFGGGKTHSMLALWHLAAGRSLGEFPQEVQDLLDSRGYADLPAHGVRRVALVGNHLAPSGRTTADGTRINTLWGELAWQLGGAEAYELVTDADRSGTAPGQALHDLLQLYAPAVILIDEWVAYARQLYGRDDLPGGTFDTQFTFAQALTEAAKATPGVLLAISIPASHTGDSEDLVPGSAEEVGGTNGIQALHRLQNVVRRVADQWRPASAGEAYHIVRQRLFVTPDARALAAINATAKSFVEFYRKHSDSFPREVRENEYQERIRQTYPIHPELFERLYEDWSSLERFQRTRGVLRLMNSVIHALWVNQDAGPLIMPGSIPLASAQVNSELTQYLQDSWKAVIDADVDGPDSEPVRLDGERPLFGARATTTRLARTVFFGAVPTIGTAQKGIETQRVFLGTAVPGDVPGNFHAALTNLSDRATYFYNAGGKHWYDLQANITRRAKDQAERLHPEEVWAEIGRRLQDQSRSRGPFAGVHVCPEDSAEIPDLDEARLVVLPPSRTHKNKATDSPALEWAYTATQRRGTASRTFCNMLIFVAADTDRMADLDTAVRDYLGWSDVLEHAHELDLTANQRAQATERQRQADKTASDRLELAYVWAIIPTAAHGEGFTLDTRKCDGQSSSLAERVGRKLGNDGEIATQQAANVIRQQLNQVPGLWPDGWVSVGDLWKAFATYPNLPRLKDSDVLRQGVLQQPFLWNTEGFALAQGLEGDVFTGLVLPGDPDFDATLVTDSVLLVRPDLAEAQRRREKDRDDEEDRDDDEEGEKERDREKDVIDRDRVRPAGPNRFYGSVRLSNARYGPEFARVVEGVISQLAAAHGVDLEITLELAATVPDEFDEAKIRTVSENATTLKFDESGFERD